MNVINIILLVTITTLLSSCGTVEDQKVLYYIYDNSMMDASLQRGKVYEIKKKDQYAINDIVVFTYRDIFSQKDTRVACRVIGTPKDTVTIKYGEIFLNGKRFLMPSTALYHYTVTLKRIDDEIRQAFNIQGQRNNLYDCFLSYSDSIELEKKYKDIIISMKKSQFQFNNKVLLNFQNDLGWDMDNFGPVWIPAVDSSVKDSFASMFINEYYGRKESNVIRIQKPLYFLIGDNFHDCSSDSRSIGLIDSDQIEGCLKL